MKLRGHDSYTSWCFYISGCPKRTSQNSSGATSHNTSSLKGLMPYGRRHCSLMQIHRPWLSQSMLYGYRCGVVKSSNLLTTYVDSRLFWLSLSTTKCKGIPFTHNYEWKRRSSAFDSSGSSIWICAIATVTMGSASMIYLPLYAVVALGFESK